MDSKINAFDTNFYSSEQRCALYRVQFMTLIYASESRGKVKLIFWKSSRTFQETGVCHMGMLIFKAQTSHTEGLVLVLAHIKNSINLQGDG